MQRLTQSNMPQTRYQASGRCKVKIKSPAYNFDNNKKLCDIFVGLLLFDFNLTVSHSVGQSFRSGQKLMSFATTLYKCFVATDQMAHLI